MKLKTLSISILALLVIAVPLVYADFDWSAPYNNLNSGYRVTTDNHGETVMFGDAVIAWAGTTNLGIDKVTFRWMSPDGDETIVEVTTFTMGEWNSQPVKEFSDTMYPTVNGDWGVQGIFYDNENPGNGVGPIAAQPFFTEIRARSFFVIPEVTMGTIAVIAAMFIALALFALKRKQQ